MKQRITAEEAISQIMNSQVPDGEPMEGAIEHMQTLQRFTQQKEFGFLSENQVEIYRG